MKSQLNYFLTALALLLITNTSAYSSERLGSISGKLIDASNHECAAYANIMLKSPLDSSIVSANVSDVNGSFILEKIEYGEYFLQISCIGYKGVSMPIHLTRSNSPMDLGDLEIFPNIEVISEVEVAEERLKGEQEVDKTVFTVNDKIRNSSSDGLDVIKHVPGVSVDFQENVTVEGYGNVLYLVNGVPRNQNFVSQLNPQDINKIELITNPGAEYDADVDAVINIVLLEHRTGGRASITGQLSNPESFIGNQSASVDYGNENFRLFFSDRLHYEQFTAKNESVTRFLTDDGEFESLDYGEGRAHWLNNSSNYGFDWFINDKNVLNLYGEYSVQGSGNKDYAMNAEHRLNDDLSSGFDYLLNSKTRRHRFYHSLFYKHKFDEKSQELTTQINHYQFSETNFNAYDYTYYFLEDSLEVPIISSRQENMENLRRMLEWRNDYSVLLGEIRFKAGAWTYYQWYDNNFSEVSDQQERFTYNEFRQEVYASASGSTEKIRWNGGLRAVMSESEIDETANNSYFEILPQFALQYVLSESSSLRLTGRRRIVRPRMSQLNPFQMTSDGVNIQTGNPDLKPELINRISLQYAKNFGSNYISPQIYLDYTTNSIEHFASLSEDGTGLMRPENIGHRYEYGISFSGAIGITKWLSVNPDLAFYNTELSGPDYYESKLGYRTNGMIMVTPWKDKDVSFITMIRYRSPRLGYKAIIKRDLLAFAGVDLAITKKLRASAYMAITKFPFMFHGVERYETDYYYSNTGSIDGGLLGAIEFKYTFNWGKSPKRLQRSTEYDSDGGGGAL